MKPIAYDLYCGLGGWAEGFLSEGYECIGYDIEKHDYGTGTYPGTLILCDVCSIHGSQCKDAAVIVASPPCQEPAFRAQPWKSARAIRPAKLPVWWNKVERSAANLKKSDVEVMTESEMREWDEYQTLYPLPPPTLFIELFNACFRIQREASEAAGHYIPLIIENVRGAEKWVGSARWHFRSYYLWGDVPALMPPTVRMAMKEGVTHRSDGSTSWHGIEEGKKFARGVSGGPWFGNKAEEEEEENRRVRGLPSRNDGIKSPGTKFSEVGFNVRNAQRFREEQGRKNDGSGYNERGLLKSCNQMVPDGTKCGGSSFGKGNNQSLMRKHSSKSNSRKAASAEIAKIPFPLAQWIAKCFKPVEQNLKIVGDHP